MVSLNPCATPTEWLRATLPNGDVVSLTKNATAPGSKDYVVNRNGQPFDNMALSTAAFDPLSNRFFGVNAAGTYYESVNGGAWAQVSPDKLTTAPYSTLTLNLVQTDSYPNGVSIVPCGSLPPTPILPTVKPTPKPSSRWPAWAIIALSVGLGVLLLLIVAGLARHAHRKHQEEAESTATQRHGVSVTSTVPGATFNVFDSNASDADWPL